METAVYRLDLRGGFHVGQQGFAQEDAALHIPADTLFSAMVVAWREAGEEVEKFLRPFEEGHPPFLLTSAFPYAGPIRFYPRPWCRFNLSSGETGLGKRLKKCRWVSEQIFARIVRYEPLDDLADARFFKQGGRVWMTGEEYAQLPTSLKDPDEEEAHLWKRGTVPRVALDRQTHASQVFHVGRVWYRPGAGLWFGVRYRDPAWRDRLERALALLGDGGVGGLRSLGNGAFTWERAAASLPSVGKGSDYVLTLSRFAPKGAEEIRALLDEGAAYGLEVVGGWSMGEGGARMRRKVRLVGEGSLLRRVGDPLGHLVDVTPAIGDLGHRVYRYGFAFPVPVDRRVADRSEEVSDG